MEETRLNLLRETAIPSDPFTFFKQWYESSHEAWSKSSEEIISNDKFVEAASHYMESYTTFYKNFSRLNEDYFSHLQLATRSDLTRVAELIIALENKVDSLQDASEELQSHYPQFAAMQPLADHLQSLAQRVAAIESRLGELPSTLQKLDTLPELGQRLDTIEGQLRELPSSLQKLDALQELDAHLHTIEGQLNALPATFTHSEPDTHLEKRLDSVEQKLDTLITLLAQTNVHQPTEATTNSIVRSNNTKTRKASKTPKKVSEDTHPSIENKKEED